MGGVGGSLSQVWTGGYPILLIGGGTPIQDQDGGYPLYRPGIGYPHPELDGVLPIQDWMGYPLPPSGDRSAQRALAMWWAVCLLRSCRRTSLLIMAIAANQKQLMGIANQHHRIWSSGPNIHKFSTFLWDYRQRALSHDARRKEVWFHCIMG